MSFKYFFFILTSFKVRIVVILTKYYLINWQTSKIGKLHICEFFSSTLTKIFFLQPNFLPSQYFQEFLLSRNSNEEGRRQSNSGGNRGCQNRNCTWRLLPITLPSPSYQNAMVDYIDRLYGNVATYWNSRVLHILLLMNQDTKAVSFWILMQWHYNIWMFEFQKNM